MKQKTKLVFSVSTCLLASHIIHPQSNLALAERLTPAQLQLVFMLFSPTFNWNSLKYKREIYEVAPVVSCMSLIIKHDNIKNTSQVVLGALAHHLQI